MKVLSGPNWVWQFPTSNKVADLEPVFRSNVVRFLEALDNSEATYTVSATRRPRQRAYLMHYAWCVWKQTIQPGAVPDFQPTGQEAPVEIEWVHKRPNGAADISASRSAAQQMAAAYHIMGLGVPPALNSLHIQGKAIDMTIGWPGQLNITNFDGSPAKISSLPRTGTNLDLIKVGATYRVIHLHNVLKDPPHWSVNGH